MLQHVKNRRNQQVTDSGRSYYVNSQDGWCRLRCLLDFAVCHFKASRNIQTLNMRAMDASTFVVESQYLQVHLGVDCQQLHGIKWSRCTNNGRWETQNQKVSKIQISTRIFRTGLWYVVKVSSYKVSAKAVQKKPQYVKNIRPCNVPEVANFTNVIYSPYPVPNSCKPLAERQHARWCTRILGGL